MNLSQSTQQLNQSNQSPMPQQPESEPQAVVTLKQPQKVKIQSPTKINPTFGQRLADKMATKVGSWGFLIGQSVVLTGWVGANLMPGVPHWDQSPFILLNLVFSFASAYTAPVVLMSQNRQSEEDRENASHNYNVTLQAAQNIELLHDKMDVLYTQKLMELSDLIKQQQTNQEVKVVVLRDPAPQGNETDSRVACLNTNPNEMFFVNVAEGQSFKSLLDLNGKKMITANVDVNQFCNS
jgi:uncharacterized membrane protein